MVNDISLNDITIWKENVVFENTELFLQSLISLYKDYLLMPQRSV